MNCLLVGLGGAVGAVCRYLLSLLPITEKGGFPVKTLCINLLGCFIIGLIASAVGKGRNIDPRLVLFLKTGLCGGFTTFSTFALETFGLLEKGSALTALCYVLVSVVFGVLAVYAGGLLIK